MFVLEEEDQKLFDRVQEQNLTRQYGLLTNSIEIGLTKGSGAFDKFLLWALNHAAVANVSQFGGRFRKEPIYVGDHKPPTAFGVLTGYIHSSKAMDEQPVRVVTTFSVCGQAFCYPAERFCLNASRRIVKAVTWHYAGRIAPGKMGTLILPPWKPTSHPWFRRSWKTRIE